MIKINPYIASGIILGIITALFIRWWYIELFILIIIGYGYYISRD